MSYVDRIFLTNVGPSIVEFMVIEEVTEDLDEGPIYLCVSEENKPFHISENDLNTLMDQGKIVEVVPNA